MLRNNASRVQPARLARTHQNGRAAVAAVRAGYLDACKGLGFRPDYETMTRANQNNYETGRLWAVSFKEASQKPPAWPANVILPRTLEATVNVVCMRHGVRSVPFARKAT